MQQNTTMHNNNVYNALKGKMNTNNNLFKRKRRKCFKQKYANTFLTFVLIIGLHLTVFISHSRAIFLQQLKQIWNSGGIGVTFISNPYNFNDHYNVCLETCRMSVSCWISGGIKVSGNCESIFHVCCKSSSDNLVYHAAEPRKITNWDDIVTNNVDDIIDPPFQEVHYGPVINDPECGKQTVSRRRVVGGRNAGFGTYPWQVDFIVYTDSMYHSLNRSKPK